MGFSQHSLCWKKREELNRTNQNVERDEHRWTRGKLVEQRFGWMNRRPHERAGGRFLNSTEKYFRRKGPDFFFFFGHPFIWHSTVAHIFTTIGHFIELIYSEKRHMHITNCVFVKWAEKEIERASAGKWQSELDGVGEFLLHFKV